MPKVSIIIPVYNVQNFLQECLESVVTQTLKEIEIICVNDGSTDESLSILEKYALKDNRIKIINKTNAGYGHTMNVGMDKASGEYIGIVESDDFVTTDMYRRLYEIAQSNDIDIIKADFYNFVDKHKNIKKTYRSLTYGKKDYYKKILNPAETKEVFKFIMNTWSGIYKKRFLDKYKIRHNETPGASYQDNGFFFQTFSLAKKIYFLDEPLYMKRMDNPHSSIHSREKVFSMKDEYDFIRNFLEKNPILLERYLGVYWFKKFHNYLFTYNRVAPEYKTMFLDHFSTEFENALDRREIEEKVFSTTDIKTMHKIVSSPEKFHKEESRGKLYKLFRKMLVQYPAIVYRSLKENGLRETAVLIKRKFLSN